MTASSAARIRPTIACVLKSGGRYTAEWVHRLKRGGDLLHPRAEILASVRGDGDDAPARRSGQDPGAACARLRKSRSCGTHAVPLGDH